MADISVFKQLMTEFGHSMGMECTLTEDSLCSLQFDDSVVLNIAYMDDTDSLLLVSYLGEISSEARDFIFTQMLYANHIFFDTGGATLGVDSETGEAALSYQRSMDGLSVHAFDRLIKQFVDIAQSWMKQLNGWNEETPGRDEAEGFETVLSPGMRV